MFIKSFAFNIRDYKENILTQFPFRVKGSLL